MYTNIPIFELQNLDTTCLFLEKSIKNMSSFSRNEIIKVLSKFIYILQIMFAIC